MTSDSDTESLAADYHDTVDHRVRNPLIRLTLALGSVITLLMALPLVTLRAVRIDVPFEVIVICCVVSVASIPIIMLFWSTEFVWSGDRLSVWCSIFIVAMGTWFAECLISVLIFIGTFAVIR
jgi:hypothetical protein